MIIKEKTSLSSFDPAFIKVVADIKREVISVGCELHFDCAEELVLDGSEYIDLWGANIYPADKKIDYISLINVRPADNNRSMEIKDPDIKKKVEEIINKLLF